MSVTIAPFPSTAELAEASTIVEPDAFVTRRGPSGFPCLDARRQYTPGLCASCTVDRCWTGAKPGGGLPLPPRLNVYALERRPELGRQCGTCGHVSDVSAAGPRDKTPTVWCDRWHWQAPITEYELVNGRVPAKAGAQAPCPDFMPAIELRPSVAADREAARERVRRYHQRRREARLEDPGAAAA